MVLLAPAFMLSNNKGQTLFKILSLRLKCHKCHQSDHKTVYLAKRVRFENVDNNYKAAKGGERWRESFI